MKIAILSRNPKLYSTNQLVEATTEREHDVRVLDVLPCYMNITSHNPDDIEDLNSTVGGAPLVIKLLEGIQGSAWCSQ